VKRIFALGSVLVVGAMLTGCPANSNQRQQVAQAAQNASIIVAGFQQGEIVAYQQGMIPAADHQFIQKELITVGTVGKALDSCILSSTSNQGIVACANTAVGAIDQINTDGGLYLKSDKAKTTFQLAMVGVKTAVGMIATIFGGK
jgi:hypothetical protein